MASKVIMPKLSPTMKEGQIPRWLKKEGDKVSMGEPLAEIDTDKATMEMQALADGVLRKILIKEGESAPLGQLIAVIAAPDEDIASLLKEAPSPAPAASQPAQTEQPAQPPVGDWSPHLDLSRISSLPAKLKWIAPQKCVVTSMLWIRS